MIRINRTTETHKTSTHKCWWNATQYKTNCKPTPNEISLIKILYYLLREHKSIKILSSAFNKIGYMLLPTTTAYPLHTHVKHSRHFSCGWCTDSYLPYLENGWPVWNERFAPSHLNRWTSNLYDVVHDQWGDVIRRGHPLEMDHLNDLLSIPTV